MNSRHALEYKLKVVQHPSNAICDTTHQLTANIKDRYINVRQFDRFSPILPNFERGPIVQIYQPDKSNQLILHSNPQDSPKIKDNGSICDSGCNVSPSTSTSSTTYITDNVLPSIYGTTIVNANITCIDGEEGVYFEFDSLGIRVEGTFRFLITVFDILKPVGSQIVGQVITKDFQSISFQDWTRQQATPKPKKPSWIYQESRTTEHKDIIDTAHLLLTISKTKRQ